MIANDVEYRITQREIQAFEASISALLDQGVDGEADDLLFRRLQVDAMRSQLTDLQHEVAAYEASLPEAHRLVGTTVSP